LSGTHTQVQRAEGAAKGGPAFPALLNRLLDAGFDLCAPPAREGARPARGWRVREGAAGPVAGALWDCPGGLSTLRFQACPGFFEQVMSRASRLPPGAAVPSWARSAARRAEWGGAGQQWGMMCFYRDPGSDAFAQVPRARAAPRPRPARGR
jgi:hypothetical protein